MLFCFPLASQAELAVVLAEWPQMKNKGQGALNQAARWRRIALTTRVVEVINVWLCLMIILYVIIIRISIINYNLELPLASR